MILKDYRDYSKSKRGSRRLLIACDECGVEFDRTYSPKLFNKTNQFCSQSCAVSSDIVQKSMRKTMLARYGAESPLQVAELRHKAKQTSLKRYGTTCAAKTVATKLKVIKTNLEKYGVTHPSKLECNKSARKATCLNRYGVMNVQQAPIVREKTKKTCFERYGVGCGFETPNARKACNSPSAISKAHQTKKRNGSYGKSKTEDKFYKFLCGKFPNENISRQVIINGWNIDFKMGDIYIQFDGVYYHGLDRPIEVIEEAKTPTDVTIYKTYLRDQVQNKWFEENDIKLVRVTDQQFDSDSESVGNILACAVHDHSRDS